MIKLIYGYHSFWPAAIDVSCCKLVRLVAEPVGGTTADRALRQRWGTQILTTEGQLSLVHLKVPLDRWKVIVSRIDLLPCEIVLTGPGKKVAPLLAAWEPPPHQEEP